MDVQQWYFPTTSCLKAGWRDDSSRAACSRRCSHDVRLPTGIFYAQGVKANVLFFDRLPWQKKPCTTRLWIYDLRTNQHFTLKEHPLRRRDLDDFVKSCSVLNRDRRKESKRFKCFEYDDLISRDKVNLDISWLKNERIEESAGLRAPKVIARDIAKDLQIALQEFASLADGL